MSQMPAGWYSDPMSSGSNVVRYWDGAKWTQHVQAAPPAAPQGAPQAETPPGAGPGGGPETAPYAAAPGEGAQEPAVGQPPAYPFPYGAPASSDPSGGNPYGANPAPPSPYGTSPYGSSPYGASPYGGDPYAANPYGGYPAPPPGALMSNPRDFTPDGARLAGWGARFGAWIIDWLITSVATAVLGFPWLSDLGSSYVDFVRESIDASEAGAPAPDPNEWLADLFPALMIVVLISLAINVIYHVGFLKWRAATPGKMALGLKVRLRDAPGPLSWATVLKRWLGQNIATLLGLIPVLGTVAGLYPFLDGLWPLWDSKRQALHDKIAGTNVIKTR